MTDDRITRVLLKQEIEDFLYYEADLLDERHYDEWLALLAEDVRYWMPMRRNVKLDDREREFTREGRDISWFDEGKETLTRRVRQIQTGIHWAEEPVSRISHLLSNIQLIEVNPSASSGARTSMSRPTIWMVWPLQIAEISTPGTTTISRSDAASCASATPPVSS